MTRIRSGWVDVLVILAAMAAVLSIFDDTFADRSYLVVGLLPTVALLGLALLMSRMHEGGWWYTLAALVLFWPLGALVALREPGPYLVPGLDTMSGLLADSVNAPITLVSTVPPVDPSGVVMLVPFLLGFLATLPAAWLALATRRPLAPAVPLLLGLAATIPLGVLVPSLLVVRGLLVAILLVAWAAVRARRAEAAPVAGRTSYAAPLTSIVTVALVAGLVALVMPSTDQSDRVLLRGRGDSVDLASMPPLTGQLRNDDTRLFVARGVPRGQRVRLAVLDQYDGAAWVTAEESPGTAGYGTFKRIGGEVAALHPGTTVVVRVRLRPGYSSDWLPMLGELTSIDLDWNPGRTEVADLRYNQATSTALVLGGVDVRDEYSFESVVPDQGLSRRQDTRDPSREQEQPSGAFLDTYLRPFARDELLPLERVLLLARYLRTNGATTTVEDFDQSPEVLSGMLASRQPTGTSFQYSALMALASSRLGVAARVVVGASPGARGRVDYADVGTWVELQFADGTWRPLLPERYLGSRAAAQEPATAPLDPDEFVREQLARAANGKDREIRPAKDSVNPDGTPAARSHPTWRSLVLVVGLVVGLVLLAYLLVPVVKLARRRRRRRSAGGWSATYVDGWQEVLDTARDRGTPVPDTWSRVAQARALGVGLDLAREADAAVFAPAATPEAERWEFWRRTQEVRRSLLTALPWQRRAWALLNPASLVAGWRRGAVGVSTDIPRTASRG